MNNTETREGGLMLEEYLEFSPQKNRLWDKKYLLHVQDITAVFDGFTALDIQAMGIAHNELRVIIGLSRCKQHFYSNFFHLLF